MLTIKVIYTKPRFVSVRGSLGETRKSCGCILFHESGFSLEKNKFKITAIMNVLPIEEPELKQTNNQSIYQMNASIIIFVREEL
jgi:hypothetical protein